MKHAFFRGLKAPLHISHRGGAALYPENTLYAFERAVHVHRTDVIELDVHATADGELVVFHDERLERCTNGRGSVGDHTYSELSRLDAAFHFIPIGGEGPSLRAHGIGIPRFLDVLRAFPEVRLNVELKHAAAVAPFVALVRAEACLERICLGSEHDVIAEELSALMPEACLFYPRGALTAFVVSAKQGRVQDDSRYAVLDVPVEWEGTRVFDAQFAALARAHQKWVNVWTVDAADEMHRCISSGVGGIMTDRPDVLRKVLST